MNKYDKKFGYNSDEAEDFHKQRIMFAIYEDKLYIAPKNSKLTHPEWFEELGWMDEENDDIMETLTRGFVDPRGVFFYSGYDFLITEENEKEIMEFLSEIKKQFNLTEDVHLYGGLIKQEKPGVWPAKKDYGKISEL